MRFRFSLQLLSLVLFVALWEVAAVLAESRLLPGPGAVLGVLGRRIGDGELPYHVAITLARVAASFLIAMVIGTAIGIAMGRLKTLDASSTVGWCCSSTCRPW